MGRPVGDTGSRDTVVGQSDAPSGSRGVEGRGLHTSLGTGVGFGDTVKGQQRPGRSRHSTPSVSTVLRIP